MSILFLCGIYDSVLEKDVQRNSKGYYDIAALEFQRKLAVGLKKAYGDINIISAPFIGSYPNRYKKIYFNKSMYKNKEIEYVSFNNIWGIRNISRALNLKKAIRKYIELNAKEKYIIVYAPHTPLMKAANFAKKNDRRIKICLVVPDLPQFQNISKKKTLIYKLGKFFDIKLFYALNKQVDSYLILSKHMREYLKIGSRTAVIAPGIISKDTIKPFNRNKKKWIVYTGNLDYESGILNLIEAFKKIDDKGVKLLICGAGNTVHLIKKEMLIDQRIKYMGIISQDNVRRILYKAMIVVSPRTNDEEYTRYSFPSKVLEYLASGSTVVAYPLDGMSEEIRQHMILAQGESVEALKNALNEASILSEKDRYTRWIECRSYLLNNLEGETLARKVIKSMEGSKMEIANEK